MTKGYFAKEIGKVMFKLATGEGVLRERIAHALPDIWSAYSLKESFFDREFYELRDFFETVKTDGLDVVSDELLKKVALMIYEIDGQLRDFLNAKEAVV